MRAGLQEAEILELDGQFVGVCLGWDFTAEHEWGIKRLRQDFGISDKNKECLGFTSDKVRVVPEDLVLIEDGALTYLVYVDTKWWDESPPPAERYESMITRDHHDKGYPFLCSWDEGSFGIRVVGEESRSKLKELYNAFQEKDVVIFLGKSKSLFGNSGLKLCIYSRIPQEAKDAVVEIDRDYYQMVDAAEATGIGERLRVAQEADTSDRWLRRCSYFALSPRWAKEKEKERTKYDVVFWLNPQDQKNNNCGWFTVEELDEWIEGKGCIPKR